MDAYEQFGRAIDAMIEVNRTSRAAHPERHKFVSVVEYDVRQARDDLTGLIGSKYDTRNA
jgi:hypothetical protein